MKIVVLVIFSFFFLFEGLYASDYPNVWTFFEVDLLGDDHNKNEVRDDVEEWIKTRTIEDTNVRNGLMQYARDHQRLLQLTFEGERYAKAYSNSEKSFACISLLSVSRDYKPSTDPFYLSQELKKKIYNSFLRRLYRWMGKFNLEGNYLSRTVPSLAESIRSCRFKIMNLHKYIPKERLMEPNALEAIKENHEKAI